MVYRHVVRIVVYLRQTPLCAHCANKVLYKRMAVYIELGKVRVDRCSNRIWRKIPDSLLAYPLPSRLDLPFLMLNMVECNPTTQLYNPHNTVHKQATVYRLYKCTQSARRKYQQHRLYVDYRARAMHVSQHGIGVRLTGCISGGSNGWWPSSCQKNVTNRSSMKQDLTALSERSLRPVPHNTDKSTSRPTNHVHVHCACMSISLYITLLSLSCQC